MAMALLSLRWMGLWCIVFFHFHLLMLMAASPVQELDDSALISCLEANAITNFTTNSFPSSQELYSLLNFSLQNLRYTEPTVRKPDVLIVPENSEQVQKSVSCCVIHGWQILVRSGGHSYEGLSSTSDIPFVLFDLMNLDAINIDMTSKTAWVEAGATLGQLYSAIAQKTRTYGFPAGVCPTIGTGGHFSGGGFSLLSRKYGLAADNIIDALLVDAKGSLLNRQKMGEDVFWALRGGGGGSWGVVVSWRIKLVAVPPVVTVFNVARTGRDAVTNLVNQWQSIAPALEEDLFIRVVISGTELNGGQRDVKLTFNGMYLGPLHQLLEAVNKSFPEMGMVSADCKETSWIDSISYIAATPTSQLPNRFNVNKKYFKAKSDFVEASVPPSALKGAWRFLEEELSATLILDPLGGRNDQIKPSEIPFPHRAGNLYFIQYFVSWQREASSKPDADYIAWIRGLYEYMTPYVSSSPRASYVNYLDLDLGAAPPQRSATVEEARSWGYNYFVQNYDRLVKAKTTIDPDNIFRNAQSIPPATGMK